jgi:hypothetical protein
MCYDLRGGKVLILGELYRSSSAWDISYKLYCYSIGCEAGPTTTSDLRHLTLAQLGSLSARMLRISLGRVDELFDANPRGHQMNECEKGLAQFLIPRGNASKLFEFVKEPFHLLP